MANKLIILLIIFSVLVTSGFGCKLTSNQIKDKMKPITLKYWRVFDDEENFYPLITRYKELHPFITIEYRKLRYDEFEQELISAMAAGRGPDLFTIHNTWTRKYQNDGLISSLPPEITMAYPVVQGTIKKDVVTELHTAKSITLKEIKDNFVDTVFDDVVLDIKDPNTNIEEQQVFGLPLFVDTLAMYYNRDLMNNAGISQPPEFWNREFQQDIKKLTKQNNKGQIVQSGVALGGSSNIERSTDILSVLMMQNGTEMIDESNRVAFHSIPSGAEDNTIIPGMDALRFYTDFVNPAKEVYCWNDQIENSLDAFTQGKLAMMLGYTYMLPIIKAKAPKLNFSTVKLPQIEGNQQNINFANYWIEVVSSKSEHKDEAWDFIQFITKADQAELYLAETKKPTALRSLVATQIDDPEIGEFADQVLTAQSWYKGYDSPATEEIFREMIDQINGGYKIKDVIRQGAKKVQQTLVPPQQY